MIQRLLLAIIILDIPFQIDTHIGHRSDLAELRVYSGYCASATTMALIALYAMWLPKLALKLCAPPRLFLRMILPLAAYVTCVALSVIWAYHSYVSLFEIFLLMQMFMMFIYIVGAVRTRDDVQFLITMLMVGLLLESVVMILLQFGGQSVKIPGISTRMSEETAVVYRSGGTVGAPNVAASYLCLLLTPALSILFTPVGRAHKWLAATAFGLGTIALVLTLSRGGWIAFGLAIPIFFLFAHRRGAIQLKHIVWIATLTMLVCLPVSQAVYGRLFANEGTSAGARMPLMRMAGLVIQDHPVLGIGANNFPIVVRRYVRPEFSGNYVSAVHNKYLLIWAETGLLSLVAFLWFLGTTMRRGWQCWRCSDPVLAFPALAFAAAIAGQMIHMGVARFTGRPQVQLLWLVSAIIAAIVCLNDEGEAAPAPAASHDRPLGWHGPYALT